MRFIFLLLVLSAPALGQFGYPEATRPAVATRPALATRPSATRPVKDEGLADRDLTPDERKEYNAALAKNRQTKLQGAESVRQQINRELAAAKERRRAEVAAQIKSMKKSETARDKAGAQRSQTYQGMHRGGYVDDIRSNKAGIRQADDELSAEQKALTQALGRLDAIEAYHNACIDTTVHVEYGQLRRAAGTQRRAEVVFRAIDDDFTGRYSSELNDLSTVAKEEYEQMPDVLSSETSAQSAGPRPSTTPDVKVGMTLREVRDLWGQPDTVLYGKWTYGRQPGTMRVVTFDSAGRVQGVERK